MRKKIFLQFITTVEARLSGNPLIVWKDGVHKVGTCKIQREGNQVVGYLELEEGGLENYYFYNNTSALPENFNDITGFALCEQESPSNKTKQLWEMFID